MTKIVEYSRVEILRKELVVLKNVTFSINKGEFAYLVGRVGSGKSSLLKSMYAEIPIPEGDAKVLEYDLTDIKRRDVPMLRRKMGIVFQDFQLLTILILHFLKSSGISRTGILFLHLYDQMKSYVNFISIILMLYTIICKIYQQ